MSAKIQLPPSDSTSPLAGLSDLLGGDLTAGAPVQTLNKPSDDSDSFPGSLSSISGNSCTVSPKRNKLRLLKNLKTPAILLLISSTTCLVGECIYLWFTFSRFLDAHGDEGVNLAELIFGLIIVIVVNIFLVRGGLCMLQQRDYNSAITTAIIALLFPLTTLFGLWALYLLTRKYTAEKFD
jgi:hypothetical protein